MKCETAVVHVSYTVLYTRISMPANASKATVELKLRKMVSGPLGVEGQ